SSEQATFVQRSLKPSSPSGQRLMVVRRRRLLAAMEERIEVRNHGAVDQPVTLELRFATDFADLFAVKEGRPLDRVDRDVEVGDDTVSFRSGGADDARMVRLRFEGRADLAEDRATWALTVPARSSCAVGFS